MLPVGEVGESGDFGLDCLANVMGIAQLGGVLTGGCLRLGKWVNKDTGGRGWRRQYILYETVVVSRIMDRLQVTFVVVEVREA